MRVAALALLAALLSGPLAARADPLISPAEWQAYQTGFLDASGRIVDTGNGGISHSEGQGYGLLLAVLAEDPANFDRIWSFTRTQLLVRDDGLAAWRWTPGQEPPVTDLNNASDGDILIAYALARAGTLWGRPELTEAARAIAEAIGTRLLFERDGRTLLIPGMLGYGEADRPDGPVVNPSYWVFEALPVLAELAPGHDWAALGEGGLSLLNAVTADGSLPPEWLSVARSPRPADGFAAEFGYNALRVPLYLLRAGNPDPALLRRVAAAMTAPDGAVRLVDLPSNATKESLDDAGYRILPAAALCALDGTPVPEALRSPSVTLYYPSTLHLLAMATLREKHPECLR